MYSARLYKFHDNACCKNDNYYFLYWPFPEWLRKRNRMIKGLGLECQETVNGTVMRHCFFDIEEAPCKIGKKTPLEKMSPAFQKWVSALESIWQDALKYDDDEHWERWALAQ